MEVPLFPLRTVLFPGMNLPLRVFEPRYVTMTRELLASGGMFGVLLIKEGDEVGGGAIPHNVGTLAKIDEARELPNGQFVLAASGVQRFRLMDWLPPRPYPYGGIELIRDEPAMTPRLQEGVATVRTTFPAYFRLALSISDQWAKGLTLPQDPHEMVDFVAPWLQLEEEAKQRLLEIEAAEDRVDYLAEVLDELLTRTQSLALEHRRRKFWGSGTQN